LTASSSWDAFRWNCSYVSISMKWKSSPSRYMNWMGRRSSCARGHFSPAWKDFSTIEPFFTFLNLIRTWAEPRPILMW